MQFAFLVIFLLVGCANKKQSTSQKESDPIITQERLECMGLCPVYKVSVYSNGEVDFVGKKNVPKTGNLSFQLSKSDFEELVGSFNEIDFFSLEENYSKDVSDGSTTYISYKSGENELRIMDYYGAPRKLKDLESKLELMVFEYLKD